MASFFFTGGAGGKGGVIFSSAVDGDFGGDDVGGEGAATLVSSCAQMTGFASTEIVAKNKTRCENNVARSKKYIRLTGLNGGL